MTADLSLQHAPGRMPNRLAWILGCAAVLIFFAQDLITQRHGTIDGAVYVGRDFINVWTAGHVLHDGKLGVLYSVKAYSAYQQGLFGPLRVHNYSYPPVSFPIASLFALLPYGLALIAWTAATAGLFVAACRKWWPETAGPAWLAALTPAAIVNIWTGQYGFVIGALFLLGWQWLDDHPRRAGIAFGLMLLKPHLAVLVPLVLLIRRDWTAIGSAAATLAVLVAASTLAYGWQPWHEFLFHTSAVQASLIDARDSFFGLMSTSAATMMLRAVSSWPLAVVVQTGFALVGIAVVALAAWRRVATRDLCFLTATATFLVLPYAFSYDLTVVAVGALAILSRIDVPPLERRLAFYGFLSPQLGIVLAAMNIPGLPLMLAGLAAAQFRLATNKADSTPQHSFNPHTASAA